MSGRALALVAFAALVAAGCGGSERRLGGGAALLPADTVAFVAARTDAGWRPFARAFLHRVPPRVPKSGADEVELAVLQGGKLVVLTHVHGAWHGGKPLRAGKPSLADAPNYREAQRALPGGTLAQGYLRGDAAGTRLAAIPGQTQSSPAPFGSRVRTIRHPRAGLSNALLRYRWGAAWLTRDGFGARARSSGPPLAATRRVRSVQQLMPAYEPALVDEIPADALAVLDLSLAPGAFELLPRVPRLLTRLFGGGPRKLRGALDAIVQGETAMYLRRGGEVTLVTSPPDLSGAEDALDRIGAARGLTLHRAEIGGQLVLSTTERGIAAFRGGGEKLSADSGFRHAGFPRRVTALAYVTAAGARLLQTRALTAYAAPDHADPTFTVRYDGGTR